MQLRAFGKVGLLVCCVFWAACLGCKSAPGDLWGTTGKLRVVCTVVPLHCLTATIAGDDAEVRCLLTSVGPHEFHPSPMEARLISGADMLIANGLGLEPFLESLVRNAGNRRLRVVRVGETLPEDRYIYRAAQRHGDHVHPAGRDPHVWLGIDEAVLMAKSIAKQLSDLDPKNKDRYLERCRNCCDRLEHLRQKGQSLRGLKFVSFHDSFRYFARSFGMDMVGSIRGTEGEDLGPEVTRQAEEFRKKGVQVIGVEPQYSRKQAENLARVIGPGVRIIELDPVETGPDKGLFWVEPDYYFRRLQENIDNLLGTLESRRASP
ncbi:MAG: hypothetical protein C4297_03510 [Gemmataceae bacterium]